MCQYLRHAPTPPNGSLSEIPKPLLWSVAFAVAACAGHFQSSYSAAQKIVKRVYRNESSWATGTATTAEMLFEVPTDCGVPNRKHHTLCGSKCSQFAPVDARHHILVSDRLQVNHRGSQVFVAHPILQGFDVADVILQVTRRKCVSKFVQEKVRAVRPFRALVAVFGDALAAIQFRLKGDALQFEFVPFVWPARLVRKDQAIRVRLL